LAAAANEELVVLPVAVDDALDSMSLRVLKTPVRAPQAKQRGLEQTHHAGMR
jgi:hypothetical protein